MSAALAGITGAVLGVSWLVMVLACGWVVRYGRVGRVDAHLCAVRTDVP